MSFTIVYGTPIEVMLAALPSPTVEPPLTEDSDCHEVSWEEADGNKYVVDAYITKNAVYWDCGFKEDHGNGQKSNILRNAGITHDYME